MKKLKSLKLAGKSAKIAIFCSERNLFTNADGGRFGVFLDNLYNDKKNNQTEKEERETESADFSHQNKVMNWVQLKL